MSAARKSRKNRRRRLSAAAIPMIAAVVAMGWATREGADADVVEAREQRALLATPSLRVATPAALALATSAEAIQLQQELSSLVAVPGWSNDDWGVLVVSLDHGDTLFSHRPDDVLAPASNLKLFTSAGALYYLGPQYRYGTYLATSAPLENGVLNGDLHLYGTGDPTLSDRIGSGGLEVWRAFADTLAQAGVREVHGDVVGDGSYFEGSATGAGWQNSYINAWYAAPAGALSFNENVATLRVTPGDEVGWRPEVLTVPGGPGVAVVNLATTVAGGVSRIEVTRAAYDGPIVVRGEIGLGAGDHWSSVPVPDPARFAAAAFREVLEESGIRVTGGVRAVHDPAQSLFAKDRKVFAPGFDSAPNPRVFAVHESPTLFEILSIVNKRSHNMYAEQVLRTLGRAVLGSGSVEGGEQAIGLMLERELGAPPRALSMNDGSGLSLLDRVSPRSVIDLLSAMHRSPMYDTYLATLPMSGERGLRRMGGTAAQGNLRAKTGTINNVSALSGYVTAANGERLAFSIISNGVPSTWRAKRVEDAIGARLASFTRPRPATTASAPRPAVETPPDSPRAQPRPDSAPPTQSPAVQTQTPAPQPQAPAAARTHVIRSGDTLDGIARNYNTTVAALRQANPGLNPRRLIPGREVRLP